MIKKRIATGILLGVLALLGGAGQAARADLMAVTFGNELIRIDATTGAGTLIGSIGSGLIGPIGLGFRGQDLYTYDQVLELLLQLDPTTGAVLDSINLGIDNLAGEGALDFRSDGVGFLSSASGNVGQLYRFEVSPPGSTPITAPGGFIPAMDGLAFDSAGVLYGLSQSTTVTGDSSLYIVDPTTGATTLVGSLGLSLDFRLGGLTFDTDGALYAALSGPDDEPSFLYRVDKSTGAATLVGEIGFDGVSGLATSPGGAPAVPEPSSLVLAGLGAAGLLGCRVRQARRRRA